MADPGMRARVERLVQGDVRVDDLTRLFLFARDRCGGRECVREIGDFVAHHNERFKGLVTRTSRDWFLSALNVVGPNSHFEWKRLPPIYIKFIEAQFRKLQKAIIAPWTGMTKAEAARLLPGLLARITQNADGTLALPANLTRPEYDLLDCLSGHLSRSPAFTEDQLFSEFSATLVSNALLLRSEKAELEKSKDVVSLFAITVMHNCTVKIDNNFSSRLDASVWPSRLDPSVWGTTAYLSVDIGHEKQAVASMFMTSLDALNHCESELLKIDAPWLFDLELSPRLCLAKLG